METKTQCTKCNWSGHVYKTLCYTCPECYNIVIFKDEDPVEYGLLFARAYLNKEIIGSDHGINAEEVIECLDKAVSKVQDEMRRSDDT